MKKNLFYLILASCLLLGACGTGETAKQDSTKADEVSAAKKAEEEKKKEEEKAEEQRKAEEERLAKEKAEQEAKVQEQAKAEEEKKQQEEKSVQQLASSLGLQAVTVTRVVDGDTVVINDGEKVRLIGINTPESTTRTEEYGKEASNYTKSKLEGKQIWIQKDVSEADRYNRLLRIVWLAVPTNDMDENEIRSKMFNADLVLNGYAEPSTYPPDVKYSEFFVKFAREARENNTGLWAYGPNGTTKGDLDPKEVASKPSSSTTNSSTSTNSKQSSNAGASSISGSSSNAPAAAPAQSGAKESFKNCTELKKKYPSGVNKDHPAYDKKHDRDGDGWACDK